MLGTPVVSGNVSLYNESGGRPIHPTPVVGCVGVLERAESAVRMAPADATGSLFLLGDAGARLRRLGVAGAGRGRERRAHPRGRPARAALAVRPARRARARRRRAALGPRRLRRRPRGRAGRGRRSPPARGVDVDARARAAAPTSTLFGECCGLVVASCAAGRRGAPGRGVRRCRRASRENRCAWAALRSRCAAASVALELPLADARAAYDGHAPAMRWRPSDVRRLRHLRARPRRRAARLLRALRAAAPRPGERRHRRLRRPPRD